VVLGTSDNGTGGSTWKQPSRKNDNNSISIRFQATHRFITVESGLTEPEVDGKPLLSLNDLEARLVFTRCKVSKCVAIADMTSDMTSALCRRVSAVRVEHAGPPLGVRRRPEPGGRQVRPVLLGAVVLRHFAVH